MQKKLILGQKRKKKNVYTNWISQNVQDVNKEPVQTTTQCNKTIFLGQKGKNCIHEFCFPEFALRKQGTRWKGLKEKNFVRNFELGMILGEPSPEF